MNHHNLCCSTGYTRLSFETPYHYQNDLSIWYPAFGAAESYQYCPYIKGQVCLDAKPLPGPFPLIVISSGYAGTAYDQSYCAEALSQCGFVVCAPSHAAFDKGEDLGCERVWYRAFEIKHSIDSLLADPYFGAICDANRIGGIGFSAGAFTMMPIAGVEIDFKQNAYFQPYLEKLAGLDFTALTDDRLKAMALYAPALGSILVSTAMQQNKIPSLVVTADSDEVLGHKTDKYIHELGHIFQHVRLENAGHYVFNSPVSNLMQKLSPHICQDVAAPRETFHPTIIKSTVDFFTQQFGE